MREMGDDFEFQLKARELYGQVVPSTGSEVGQTYVDPSDGTVYVWDDARQGWFPKVMYSLLNKEHPQRLLIYRRIEDLLEAIQVMFGVCTNWKAQILVDNIHLVMCSLDY